LCHDSEVCNKDAKQQYDYLFHKIVLVQFMI